MSEDFLAKEYFDLQDTIKDFDQRLITIKGWGVTLGLAALGIGFQAGHYGLFLVAAVSGVAFWLIEGVTKRHQVRFYYRIREIEISSYERTKNASPQIITPLISWSWQNVPEIYEGKMVKLPLPPKPYEKYRAYNRAWLLPHVLLPHVISMIVGSILFILGVLGILGMPL